MAKEYQIDTHGRIAYVKATGESGFSPSVEAIKTLTDDDDFRPEYAVLVDLRCVDCLPTVSEVRAFAELLDDANILSNRMGLVVSEKVNTGINQMAAAITRHRGKKVGAFLEFAEAKAWLEENKFSKQARA